MARKYSFNGNVTVRYFEPVLLALNQLGGSGYPSEVKEAVAKRLHLSAAELDEALDSGPTRFEKQVEWARFYLARAGYINSSERGVWRLTDKGRAITQLSLAQAQAIFDEVRTRMTARRTPPQARIHPLEPAAVPIQTDNTEPLELDSNGEIDYRSELLQLLRSLPPAGFERLCQRLLRESGFERVTVTGRPGDGGIDGIGMLQVSPFLGFKVYFQCKRYSGSVTASQVRDFRGALAGRADKGLLLTTGAFTADAHAEAAREGAAPIDLVDSEKLLDLFETLQLGLKPRKSFDVDRQFFDEFRQ